MLDPLTINTNLLPCVPLESCHQLPDTPCIYFAIDSQGTVQYIGRSINPRLRWTQHHRYKRLAKMNGVKIAYLAVNAGLMADVEQALIVWFNPPLNNLSAKSKADVSINRISEGLQVKRVVETVYDFPGLGQRIRQAREQDERSVSEICRKSGISRSY